MLSDITFSVIMLNDVKLNADKLSAAFCIVMPRVLCHLSLI